MILKELFSDKTRWQHFLYAIPVGLVFSVLCVLGLATGMEFKDKEHGGKFDWGDWTCTMLGGLVGEAVRLLIVYFMVQSWK
jgi:hypothetical protein